MTEGKGTEQFTNDIYATNEALPSYPSRMADSYGDNFPLSDLATFQPEVADDEADSEPETEFASADLRCAGSHGGDGCGSSVDDSPDNRSKLAELPAQSIETTDSLTEVPHVASQAEIINFADFATRGKKNQKPVSSFDSASATCGKKPVPHVASGRWQVDYVRASENTYAFRLRWAEGKKRGTPIYVSRVSITVFQMIRKGNYDAFKKQLISSHCESTLPARLAAG